MGRQIQPLTFSSLIHPELEIPQISVNPTSAVGGEDAVAATCYTNDSHIQWYVNYVPVSGNYRMTVSPDNKTLIIQMFSRFDSPLQCGIEILPELIQKSDLVYVTVACECSGVVRVKLGVGLRVFPGCSSKTSRTGESGMSLLADSCPGFESQV